MNNINRGELPQPQSHQQPKKQSVIQKSITVFALISALFTSYMWSEQLEENKVLIDNNNKHVKALEVTQVELIKRSIRLGSCTKELKKNYITI